MNTKKVKKLLAISALGAVLNTVPNVNASAISNKFINEVNGESVQKKSNTVTYITDKKLITKVSKRGIASEKDTLSSEISVEGNKVIVLGQVSPQDAKKISLNILDSNKHQVYVNQFKTSDSGKYYFSFDFSDNETGKYKLQLNTINSQNKIEKTFDFVKETEQKKIVSLEKLNDLTLKVGDKYTLPLTVKVKNSDGSEEFVPVTWDSSLDTTKPGVITLNGVVEGTDLTVSLKITVKGKEVSIVSLEKLSDITLGCGEKCTLPPTIKAKMSDGSERDVVVVWDKEISTKKAAVVKLTGRVEGTNLTVPLKVKIKKQKLKITKVEKLKDVVIKYGAKYKLPEKVQVTMSDGSVKKVMVVWDSVVDTTVSGKVTLRGNIEGSELIAELKVTVKNKGKEIEIDNKTDENYKKDAVELVNELKKIADNEDLSDSAINAQVKELIPKASNAVKELKISQANDKLLEKIYQVEEYIYAVDQIEPKVEKLEESVKGDLTNYNTYVNVYYEYCDAIQYLDYYETNSSTYNSLQKRMYEVYRILNESRK